MHGDDSARGLFTVGSNLRKQINNMGVNDQQTYRYSSSRSHLLPLPRKVCGGTRASVSGFTGCMFWKVDYVIVW